MAKYSNTIQYNLKTSADLSGVTQLKNELKQISNILSMRSDQGLLSESATKSTLNRISRIEKAFSSAFNPKFGMFDTAKLNKSLGNLNFSQVYKDLAKAGTVGKTTFNSLIAQTAKFETGLKSTSSVADKLFNTFGNTVRWGITASIFETMSNRLRDSVQYIKDLDQSLNDIRIVSESTAEEMRKFSLYANDAAKNLGKTTVDYTNAALIFAQQGYNLEDQKKMADLTLKVANTTRQTTAEVSEQLTSWTNGYQMSIEQLEKTLDKVTKVAAVGASDTQELMTAAAKVASTAATLGVTEDQLISQMSTIISVTREAPKTNSKIAWAA